MKFKKKEEIQLTYLSVVLLFRSQSMMSATFN